MCPLLEEIWFHGTPPPFKLFSRVTFATSFDSNHNDLVIVELVLVVNYEVETVLALVPSLVIKMSCMPSTRSTTTIFHFLWHVHPPKGVIQIKSAI